MIAVRDGSEDGGAHGRRSEESQLSRDLYITTAQIPRTRLRDLPYGLEVYCTRTTGWELRDMNQMLRPDGLPSSHGVLLAGEYDGPDEWLVLDVAGHVILDSRATAGEGADE